MSVHNFSLNEMDAFHTQLNTVLAKGEMNKIIAQLCENAGHWDWVKDKDHDLQLAKNTIALSYLMAIPCHQDYEALMVNHVLYLKFLYDEIRKANNNSGIEIEVTDDWYDVLEKIVGDESSMSHMKDVLEEAYKLHEGNKIKGNLVLNAFRGEGVPKDIKTLADEYAKKGAEESLDSKNSPRLR